MANKVKKALGKTSTKAPAEFVMIAKRFKALREQAGKSKEAMADEADISRTLYSDYEKGLNLTWANICKIIRAHKMTIPDFFSEGFD